MRNRGLESQSGHGPASISDREVAAVDTVREEPPPGPSYDYSDGKAGSPCRVCGVVLGFGRVRGLCQTCYYRHRRAGTIETVALPRRRAGSRA
jgi:hypothetical protein